MQLLYNNRLLQENELRLPLTSRAFQYNDGLFETIMIRQGRLCFWESHVQRMQEAAAALHIVLPPAFSSSAFPEKLLELASLQNAQTHGRLKLKVWRAGAGIYTPETNEVDWMATVQPASPILQQELQVGVCKQVQTQYSPLSHFKGPNAPFYVLAGIEKKERQKDDMLILDKEGMVSEFISSNVFWVREGKLHTPALKTGCVHGVLRRNILSWCNKNQVEVIEELTGLNHLYQADAVFAANVTGIRTVASIEDISIKTHHALVKQLDHELLS